MLQMIWQPYTTLNERGRYGSCDWPLAEQSGVWLAVAASERAERCVWLVERRDGGGERLSWSAGLCRDIWLLRNNVTLERKVLNVTIAGRRNTGSHTPSRSNLIQHICKIFYEYYRLIQRGYPRDCGIISPVSSVCVYLCCFTFQWCESEKAAQTMTARSRVHYWKTAPI